MSVSVSMPQLGESVTEGTVTRWLKKEGERVEADEPLLEVSTDKVDTEIPSPVSGILRGITVAEDETVAVGAELAVIDETGGEAAEAPPPAAEAAPDAGAARRGRPGAGAARGRPRIPAGPGRPGVPASVPGARVPAGPGRPGVPAGPGRPGVPARGCTGARVPARWRAGPAGRLCPAVDVHARRPGGTGPGRAARGTGARRADGLTPAAAAAVLPGTAGAPGPAGTTGRRAGGRTRRGRTAAPGTGTRRTRPPAAPAPAGAGHPPRRNLPPSHCRQRPTVPMSPRSSASSPPSTAWISPP